MTPERKSYLATLDSTESRARDAIKDYNYFLQRLRSKIAEDKRELRILRRLKASIFIYRDISVFQEGLDNGLELLDKLIDSKQRSLSDKRKTFRNFKVDKALAQKHLAMVPILVKETPFKDPLPVYRGFCPHCGTTTHSTDRYCPSCGQSLRWM